MFPAGGDDLLAAKGFEEDQNDGKEHQGANQGEKNSNACQNPEVNRGAKARKNAGGKAKNENHCCHDHGLTDIAIGVVKGLEIMLSKLEFITKTVEKLDRGVDHKAQDHTRYHGRRGGKLNIEIAHETV